MGYIPSDAEWYLADVIMQVAVEDDPRTVVHSNIVLIRADSPDEAYEKALEIGHHQETTYKNTDGKQVQFRFRGLKSLNVVYDELADGAELTYSEEVGVPEEEIQRRIVPKEELSVFAPLSHPNKPNYASRDIYERVRDLFPDSEPPPGVWMEE